MYGREGEGAVGARLVQHVYVMLHVQQAGAWHDDGHAAGS